MHSTLDALRDSCAMWFAVPVESVAVLFHHCPMSVGGTTHPNGYIFTLEGTRQHVNSRPRVDIDWAVRKFMLDSWGLSPMFSVTRYFFLDEPLQIQESGYQKIKSQVRKTFKKSWNSLTFRRPFRSSGTDETEELIKNTKNRERGSLEGVFPGSSEGATENAPLPQMTGGLPPAEGPTSSNTTRNNTGSLTLKIKQFVRSSETDDTDGVKDAKKGRKRDRIANFWRSTGNTNENTPPQSQPGRARRSAPPTTGSTPTITGSRSFPAFPVPSGTALGTMGFPPT